MKKLLIAVCCLFSVPVFAGQDTILVIESYHKEYLWDASYRQGIQEVIGEQYQLKYFEMDTKRLPESRYQERADNAWETYEALQPALVIVGDDNALKFVGPRLAETRIPVVYLGINGNPRTYFSPYPTNMTGVLERPLLGHSVRIIKKLLPDIKNLLVLFDSGTTSQTVVAETFAGQTQFRVSGVTVDVLLINSWEAWKETVLQSTQKYDAIVAGLYHTIVDAQGEHVSDVEIIRWTSEHTPLPPFCFWDFAVGNDKTIGGLVLYGKEQGELAAKIALEILEGGGIPKRLLPMTTQKGRLLFSKTQLKKYNIRLPADIAEKANFIQ